MARRPSDSSGMLSSMNRQEIATAFEDVFDQAIVFHGFAEHMRDYDVFVYATADPRTGIAPEHLRYRFTHCVRATATTAVRRDVWQRSLDERLLDYEAYAAEPELDGYVWGSTGKRCIRGCRSARSQPRPTPGRGTWVSRSSKRVSRPTATTST